MDTTTSTFVPATRTDHRRLSARLDREWASLRCRRGIIRQVRSWQVVEVPLEDLDELLTLAGRQRPADSAAEEVLRRLVILGRTEDLAARIVLQRILPGLLASARIRSGAVGNPELFEELVGAAWITIRTFDPRRRPSCLAAALLRGAEHRAYKAAARRRSASEIPTDQIKLDRPDLSARVTPFEELIELIATAQQHQMIDEEDLELLRQLLADRPAVLAARLGVTTRTVRNRRDRVTYRLRRAALAA